MKLLHYSATPFKFDPAHRYKNGEHYKPQGLWVSVEGDHDWRWWCEGENFQLKGLTHAAEVVLAPGANILVIDTVDKLDAFNLRFGNGHPYFADIKWDEVKALHDGLIIAPYQWRRRLDLMWYYGWDCASGVIWNLSAVSNVVRQ